jgi:SAM-dependent MidA family methyltransferase
MAGALYGPEGFFARPSEGPADHFRTSVHASPLFAAAVLRLINQVDAALGYPDRLDVVDIGAGRGELLSALHVLLPADPTFALTASSPASSAGRIAPTEGPAGENDPSALGARLRDSAETGTSRSGSAEAGMRWGYSLESGAMQTSQAKAAARQSSPAGTAAGLSSPAQVAAGLSSPAQVAAGLSSSAEVAAGLGSPAQVAVAAETNLGVASGRGGGGADRGAGGARGAAGRLRRSLAERIRFVGVEVAPRPAGLAAEIGWRRDLPEGIVGMLLATEWLDNVPLDVGEVDTDGRVRRVLVDPATGRESLGADLDAAGRFWLARWWPSPKPGDRVEVGWPRDAAWADAVSRVRRGCALAVDYGHLRADRPPLGTLTGFRAGRQMTPIPDGSCDVTAHVAVDAAAEAAGHPYRIVSQREALRGLGVDGGRPPLDLAHTDPAGYLRALSSAGAAAELTDPAGLGGHWWLLHEVGIDLRGTIQA